MQRTKRNSKKAKIFFSKNAMNGKSAKNVKSARSAN